MQFELVVFDMAGTTVLDRGSVNDAFREAFAASGIEVDAADIDMVMGYRKIEAIEIILRKYIADEPINETLVAHIHETFTNNMVEFYEIDSLLQPLPFVLDTFELLQSKGIKVALNTGFTRIITDAILNRLHWKNNPLIDAVICSDEVPEGRPHPYMIQSIMQQLGVTDAKKVIKIGDTSVDILEGRNAGCGLVISVTTGAYTRGQLSDYRPDHIIDSLQELPVLIA